MSDAVPEKWTVEYSRIYGWRVCDADDLYIASNMTEERARMIAQAPEMLAALVECSKHRCGECGGVGATVDVDGIIAATKVTDTRWA